VSKTPKMKRRQFLAGSRRRRSGHRIGRRKAARVSRRKTPAWLRAPPVPAKPQNRGRHRKPPRPSLKSSSPANKVGLGTLWSTAWKALKHRLLSRPCPGFDISAGMQEIDHQLRHELQARVHHLHCMKKLPVGDGALGYAKNRRARPLVRDGGTGVVGGGGPSAFRDGHLQTRFCDQVPRGSCWPAMSDQGNPAPAPGVEWAHRRRMTKAIIVRDYVKWDDQGETISRIFAEGFGARLLIWRPPRQWVPWLAVIGRRPARGRAGGRGRKLFISQAAHGVPSRRAIP